MIGQLLCALGLHKWSHWIGERYYTKTCLRPGCDRHVSWRIPSPAARQRADKPGKVR